jgi:type IV pilus assembly protein PilB
MATLKERLIEILLSSKCLTQEQLDKAFQIQRQKSGVSLRKILVEEGFITENELVSLLSQQLKVPPISLSRYKIDPQIINLIPERIARHYHLIPISRIGNTLTVSMSDPLNIFALDDLKTLTQCEIDPVLSTDKEILGAINKYYQKDALELSRILEESKAQKGLEVIEEKEGIDISETIQESEQPPIVKIVNLMIAQALKKRASDIHIEPTEGNLRIRYRIDGALHDIFSFPKRSQNAILARIKILSGLDITESRLPQDGRFKVKFENREVDFRVSVLPITFGGKVVLRALDKSNLSIGLERLGFLPEPLALFKEAIANPFGMILVTGPTGSGKSTTLYSILNQLNTYDKNIITIEDPVEYLIEGITQIQVNPEIGLNFASGLRSLLRQSPDIIMVGEIRDSETADIAVKASLTGQLVFSTLHTNDAAGTITRLIDMGVEPYLVASSLIMTSAQRLCRKICPNCKEPHPIAGSILDELGLKIEKGKVFYRGKGCPTCNYTGFYGRMGVLEVLMIDDQIREMIVKGASSDQIEIYAVKRGMKTLRDNGLINFLNGQTTLEEVMRITTEV